MIENSLNLVAAKKWDIAIVGAGTVGLLTAKILAEKGLSVLCLESGGASLDDTVQVLNNSIQIGERHLGINEARARVIGGTSTLWGGQLARFTRTDFEARPEIGQRNWDVTFDEIEPWYGKVAEVFNLKSYESNYSNTLVRMYGENPPLSDDVEFYVTHWLKVPNFYRFFKRKITAMKNFVICPNSHVVRISFSDCGEHVSHLVVKNTSGLECNIFASKIILSNGTMEISRLLHLSAKSEFNNVLSSHSMIGAYFQDHLDISCGQVDIINKKNFLRYFENGIDRGNKIQPKLRLTRKKIIETGVLNVGGAFCFESGLSEDIQYLKSMVKSFGQLGHDFDLNKLPQHIRGLAKVWWPLAWRYVKNKRIMAFVDHGVSFRAHMEQSPIKESAIRLSKTGVDKFGDPLIELDWKVNWPLQAKTLKDFCLSISKYLEDNKLANFNVYQQIIDEDVSFIRSNCRDSFHQCGGAVMSEDVATGVVDKNCKVHKTRNLYVAGSAIFPSSSYANPTFTALAFAARMCDHISEK